MTRITSLQLLRAVPTGIRMDSIEEARQLGGAIISLIQNCERRVERSALDEVEDLRVSHLKVHDDLGTRIDGQAEQIDGLAGRLADLECQMRTVMARMPIGWEGNDICGCHGQDA